MHYGGWNWGMNLWMILWWLVIAGIIFLAVYGVVALFTRGRLGQPPGSTAEHEPLRILKERYARGEISTEEYQRMREELKD